MDARIVNFTAPSAGTGGESVAAEGVAATAMAERRVPMISLGDVASVRLYEVLYGYERECGRSVLVMVRRFLDRAEDMLPGPDVAVFGEVIAPGIMWHDGGPSQDLHEAMLAGAPGETITWEVNIGGLEYTRYLTRSLRRLSEAEMAALVAVDYRLPANPMRPKVRRTLGENVDEPIHDCEVCYWA